jgi:hypothetical protein
LMTGLGEAAGSVPDSPCADGAPALVVAMWRCSLRIESRRSLCSFCSFHYTGMGSGVAGLVNT